MMPGETYADFAAGLRDLTGQNHISERVLLAQFYRSLDKTARQLVKQRPKPRTLEEAVDKATEIDDPIDNVAQGMQNIGQAWATAPNPYLVPMDGTTGQVMMIPGVRSCIARLGEDGQPVAASGNEEMAHFTNPQGSGTTGGKRRTGAVRGVRRPGERADPRQVADVGGCADDVVRDAGSRQEEESECVGNGRTLPLATAETTVKTRSDDWAAEREVETSAAVRAVLEGDTDAQLVAALAERDLERAQRRAASQAAGAGRAGEKRIGRAKEAMERRYNRRGAGRRATGHVSLTRRVAMTTPTTVVNQYAAAATDGLLKAHMVVSGEYREVKLDSGARYSVAGIDWMAKGERLDGPAPVDQVEGIGGFLLDVLGVWVFEMRNTFGQSVQVTACIIDGCTGEFSGGSVLLAATLTRAYQGKALVPAISAQGGRTKPPANKELGVWIPLSSDLEALELNGDLDVDKLDDWMATLGDTSTPHDNESEVVVKATDPGDQMQILKLLRTYREVMSSKGRLPSSDRARRAASHRHWRHQAHHVEAPQAGAEGRGVEEVHVRGDFDGILGHELCTEGVRPVDRLITAVTGFPRPTNPVDVKRFVHLAGYYRKFIAALGSIMAAMTRLLKKDTEWERTTDQEFAFERMKAALTSKPLLAYPDFGRPFRLETDASQLGLGACLMQDQGRGWQPIAYASKVSRRLHRWSLTLQEYVFEISYRPRATNVVADALSRAPAAVRAVAGSQAARQQRTNAGDEDAGERTPATKTLDDARLSQTVADVARRVQTPPTAAAEATARSVLPAHAVMDNKRLNQTVVPTPSTAIAEAVARRVSPAPTVSKRTRAVTRSMARQASGATQPVEPVEHAAAGHARVRVAGEAVEQQPPARRPRREQHVHWADANSVEVRDGPSPTDGDASCEDVALSPTETTSMATKERLSPRTRSEALRDTPDEAREVTRRLSAQSGNGKKQTGSGRRRLNASGTPVVRGGTTKLTNAADATGRRKTASGAVDREKMALTGDASRMEKVSESDENEEGGGTLQIQGRRDHERPAAQRQRDQAAQAGEYKGMKVETAYGLAVIKQRMAGG
ncbi:unnamed protein product [Phytophthora lilii]|uniref:Unnamed protein product n=1 Tax=Phytophthora lilii TaxID=2077276 RepID=A0A9W6X7I8_9STRA|nr:unnamed protein product [Phytophthora lilii]